MEGGECHHDQRNISRDRTTRDLQIAPRRNRAFECGAHAVDHRRQGHAWLVTPLRGLFRQLGHVHEAATCVRVPRREQMGEAEEHLVADEAASA